MPLDPLLELEAEVLATVRRLAASLAPISLVALPPFSEPPTSQR